MAKLNLTVDSLDGLDEATKSLYVQEGDKFKLDVDGIEDTSGLKNALQAERKIANALDKKIKGYEKLGKTPEEIAELVEKQEQIDRSQAEKRGEFDKILAQVNEKNAQALKAKDETLAQMRKRLESELVDSKAIAAIAAAKGKTKLLLPLVKNQLRVDENFNVIVLNADGETPKVNDKGDPLTINDLVNEMRASEDYGAAFEGTGQSGSGTRPTNGSGGSPLGRLTKADLQGKVGSPEWKKKNALIAQHGWKAYENLPEK
jgi:hypothetical protein